MRSLRFGWARALTVVTALCTATGSALSEQASDWLSERGWLVRPGITHAGGDTAVEVYLGDHGALLKDRLPEPQMHSLPSGGFEVRYETDAGVLLDRFERCEGLGETALCRSLEYTNTSEATQDLLGSEMRLCPVARDGGETWTPKVFRMVEVEDGRALCVAFWNEAEPCELFSPAGRIDVKVNSCWRLAPGETATIGTVYMWLCEANQEAFRTEAQRWYELHGFTEPIAYPDCLAHGVLYEASAGGHVESRFSDAGGFDAFAHQLEYLADLGVSAFWLNAVHQHKTPPNPVEGGWNHYDPRDLSSVDSILGGSEGFRRLVDKMRALDLHLISEAVPHGGHSVQAQELERWWTRGRDGEPVRPWGGYGMDNASPEWQGVIRDWMGLLAIEFGIEGARIDVADGQGPNWRSPRTNHASFSTVGAGIEMMQAIRDGIAEGAYKQPVLIPESTFRPEYFAISNAAIVGYGLDTTNLFRMRFPHDLSDASTMNRILRGHFDNELGSLPPGALVLRTLNNHDTVVDCSRVQMRFRAGLARALYGMCVTVPGVPMMYQEEEVGSFEALRRLNWARRCVPELGTDRAVYPPEAYFAPEVFAVLRPGENADALCLVNLSGRRIESTETLPDSVDAADGSRLFDAVSGDTTDVVEGAFTWMLKPYETAILRIGKPAKGLPPPLRFMGEPASKPVEASSRLEVEVSEEGVTIRFGDLVGVCTVPGVKWERTTGDNGKIVLNAPVGSMTAVEHDDEISVACELTAEAPASPPTFRVFNADRWYASGRTALLADRLLRRHFPFPALTDYEWKRTHTWGQASWGQPYNHVLPCGRLWQSLFEPLHPKNAGIAFADGNGKALLLSEIETDAMNVVLTDCTDEEDVEPYRLETRFYAVDRHLHPNVQHYGWAQPWILDELAPVAPRSVEVSFRIRAIERDVSAHLEAERLPVQTGGAEEIREGEQFNEWFGAVWLPQRGRITWNGLAPVAGAYRIEFELRHSETGPEGTDQTEAYRVEVDGVEQPLDWVQLNTVNTGNAYFGKAQTPPIDLSGKGHTISITTTKTWCAIRRGFRLKPGELAKRGNP